MKTTLYICIYMFYVFTCSHAYILFHTCLHTYIHTYTDKLTPDQVNDAADNNMPLCMKNLHNGLKKDNKLKHWGRLQYGLFLKVVFYMHTCIHIHTYIHIYIYIYICFFCCLFVIRFSLFVYSE